MKKRLLALLLCIILTITGCKGGNGKNNDYKNPEEKGDVADLGDGNKTFGESLDDLGIYDGYFDGEEDEVSIECVYGTKNAYKLENGSLIFTSVTEETVYAISGSFSGNILIDVGDSYKFELELYGFSLVCDFTNPITILSGDKVSIKAKRDTENFIYDTRPAIDETDESLYSGAIHSASDLEIAGKGSLVVYSENNNGIHSKKDLEVKNLSLIVTAVDNSLKGNDSVEITEANTTLISTGGDCIKTTNSNLSEKGKQRGVVSIIGGTHSIYAACDGIDAAYDTVIDGSDTVINIYTDKYSNYSEEITETSSGEYYIRFTSSNYSYSVKYYNSDSDYVWVDAVYHSSVNAGRSTYYYYSFPKNSEYSKMQFYIYSSGMEQGREDCLVCSDYLTPNTSYDTFALSTRGGQWSYNWTNYSTSISGGGFGGMQDGNNDKGDHSTKGIKSSNQIIICGGTVNIKSYDDAIHANSDETLENGETPLGNITVKGGSITVYSNDDGLHADGKLTVSSGTLSVSYSYEGLEGTNVEISGGYVSVVAMDDGINATATSGESIVISGGTVYIYCTGDGIDSNSRTSYSGIVFSGGNTVIISASRGNSAIDSDGGYSYTGGAVVAIMSNGGMVNEARNCKNFSSCGRAENMSLSSDSYLVAKIGSSTATVRIPVSISAYVVLLGSSSAELSSSTSSTASLDENGVNWS